MKRNRIRYPNILQSQGFQNAVSSVMAIIVGLLFGFIVLLISKPDKALQGLGVILAGGFTGGAKGMGQVLYFATPLIMTGLSVGFAFKTGLFNIGATGQFTVGTFAAIYVGIHGTMFGPFQWVVALLAATAAGALWALIPGLFKAYLNVSEVISSIMMNYIGLYLVNVLVKGSSLYDMKKALTKNVAPTAEIPRLGLDKIFSNVQGNNLDKSTLNIGFFIAVGIAILIFIILNRTTFGYELKACGYNRHASRYAGINEKRNIVLSMVIAGALAGLGGGLLHLCGVDGRHYKAEVSLLSEGFAGIPVALLGLSNPVGIIFSAIFMGYIAQGGSSLQRLGYAPEGIEIITSVIIYFAAFSLLFRSMIARLFGGGAKKQTAETQPLQEAAPDKTGTVVAQPEQSVKGGGKR